MTRKEFIEWTISRGFRKASSCPRVLVLEKGKNERRFIVHKTYVIAQYLQTSGWVFSHSGKFKDMWFSDEKRSVMGGFQA